MAPPLRICYAAAEIAPFAKTGGLADVGAALPRELARAGHDARTFLPLYASIDRRQRAFHRVDFAQDVPLVVGPRRYVFSLWTAPLADGGPAGYFVDCPELFGRPHIYTSDDDEPQRFAVFTRAVLESCQRMGWAPHVFHCNDWHTALLPLLLRTIYGWDALFRSSRTLLTIHNIGYQGVFGAGRIRDLGLDAFRGMFDADDLRADRVNFLRTGLRHADLLSTVSPTYAREIQTAEYGMGLEGLLRTRSSSLVGILNGVDYEEWSPETDRHLPHRYSAADLAGKALDKRHLLGAVGLTLDPALPLAGIVSRLVPQKGFELCYPVLPDLLGRGQLGLVAVGTGDAPYEEFFAKLERGYPGRAVHYRGYSNELAHLVEAGADLFLMPSRYEPCGLNQMFSLRYGTLPVVRRTGGLADSVEPYDPATGAGTGFVFEHFTADGLGWALGVALAAWRDRATWTRLQRSAMARDFSWHRQAERYVGLYSRLAGLAGG